MNKRISTFSIILTLLSGLTLQAASDYTELFNNGPEHEERMQWWRDARFGLFIHWGIYSIPGGLWKGQSARKDYAEWVMHNFEIPFDEYSQLAKQFNPTQFNPDEWAELAKAAGMGYFVLTTKHHDGFAMFDSAVSDYNIVDATPFDRDVFGELAQAFRKRGMQVGAYYSQDLDWSQPQGATISSYNTWDYPYDKPDYEVFDQYLHGKSLPQIKELSTKYGDIGVFWFDFPRMVNAERGKLIQDLVRKHQPGAIISGRICNPQGMYADYLVPGDNGYYTVPQPLDWECCATMDESWGYKINAHANRSADSLIQQLCTTVSSGGNLLLNIGPKPDGTIPQRQVDILKEIAIWMKDNREAIHGNRANPFGEFFPWGVCTTRDKYVYLHVTDWKNGQSIVLPRLKNKVSKVELLGDAARNLQWSKEQDNLRIILDGEPVHTSATVIKVTCAGKDLKIAPLNIRETDGKVVLESRYGNSYAQRMRRLRHSTIDGNVVLNATIGHSSEYATWDFDIKKPGTFNVVLTFDHPQLDKIGKRTLVLNEGLGNEVSALVTGNTINAGKQSIGKVSFTNAGPNQLFLKVADGTSNPLYLSRIELHRVD